MAKPRSFPVQPNRIMPTTLDITLEHCPQAYHFEVHAVRSSEGIESRVRAAVFRNAKAPLP